MKIRRGGRTSTTFTTTDAKQPRDYASSWYPGGAIVFDGTIDKSGERHTELAVVIEEQDVLALQRGLIEHYRDCVRDRDRLQGTVRQLESALNKISHLLSWHRGRAPDQDSLIAAVAEIADHFGRSWNRSRPYKSQHTWLKYKTL